MTSKKILMATMGMGIGGAETHILELCKALAKRGHEITVASNGGVYVQELTAAGITHVEIPMHLRSMRTMVKSYFALRRLIRQEGFDIVHAHARIPGFLCGLVKKPKKTAFVTTAHGVFTAGGLAGRLSNWGEKTLAVSEDVKTYLMKNYGVKEENIFLTVNGIDTDRFSPDISGEVVREEFQIPLHAPVILHVSRLDAATSDIARQLLHIAPALLERWPDLHILLVGGGDQLGALKGSAKALNEGFGRRVIHMAGTRTDIGTFIAASDMFVGVSRAALEAMSGAKPVVLAGAQGYIGIFGPEKLQVSVDTNFCCRDCGSSTEAKLLEDISTILDMDVDNRTALGQYGRETVQRSYSVETMTEDTLRAYEAALRRERRILLSGYYGYHNAGDEAILEAFHQSARSLPMPVQITVLSNTPAQTAEKYGTSAVYRFNVFSVCRAMWRTDVLVSGGGSLLPDKSSTRSIIYYLSLIRLAKFFKRPVMLYANGIGPVDKPANRRRVRRVVSRAELVTLREEHSRDELLRMGVKTPVLHVTADPIFLLRDVDQPGALTALQEAGVPEGRPLLGLSVRSLRTGAAFVQQMAEFCDLATRELGCAVVFVAMQRPQDVTVSRAVMERMTEPSYILGGDLSPEALIGACEKMELVIAMRLHTMLFAAKARIPVIGLICDPKIEYFSQKLDMPSGGPIEEFDPRRLVEQAKATIAERAAYQTRLVAAINGMDGLAEENSRYLAELLEKA